MIYAKQQTKYGIGWFNLDANHIQRHVCFHWHASNSLFADRDCKWTNEVDILHDSEAVQEQHAWSAFFHLALLILYIKQ